MGFGARRQFCDTALRRLVLTTVFISTLSWTLLLTGVSGNEHTNDVRSWLEMHSIPEKELQQQRDSSWPTKSRDSTTETREVMWKPVSSGAGIGDTMATVGRVLKSRIPNDAFRGDVSRYEVSIGCGQGCHGDICLSISESIRLSGMFCLARTTSVMSVCISTMNVAFS